MNPRKTELEILFDALYSGMGIQAITNAAYALLGNPLSVCDTSFSMISHIPLKQEEEYLDQVGERKFIKEALVEDMRKTGVVDAIYNSPLPFLARALSHTPFSWIYEGVRIRNSVVAYICLCDAHRPFAEKDLEILHMFTRMLSVEMQKDTTYSHKAGVKYEFFLTELLEGKFERSREYLTNQLILLGHQPAASYHILVCRFEDESAKKPGIRFFYDQILSLLPGAMVVMFRSRITILFPASHPPFPYLKERLSTFLKMNHMIAAISYGFRDIADSPHYFRQIEELLALPKLLPDPEGFLYYGDYYLQHMIHKTKDTALLKASIHPGIKALEEYDREHRTSYRETLLAYLKHNRSASLSAKALHIHKSTFFYRLTKISELFGLDLSRQEDLFAYEYSFAILSYLA